MRKHKDHSVARPRSDHMGARTVKHTGLVPVAPGRGHDRVRQGALEGVSGADHGEAGANGLLLLAQDQVPGAGADAVGRHHNISHQLLPLYLLVVISLSLKNDASVVGVLKVLHRARRVPDRDA